LCRFSQGILGTDKKFTGQRLDGTGLYYYNARYYDPLIGRFISSDTAAPDLMNPQSFNKYSYCFNNPLNRTDPSGEWPTWANIRSGLLGFAVRLYDTLTHPSTWVAEQFVNTVTGPSGPKIDIVPSILPVQYVAEDQQFSYMMGRYASDVAVQTGIAVGIGYAVVGSGSGITSTENYAIQGSTDLYRAVNPAELADLKNINMFRNLGYAEGKYFALTEEGANSYTKLAYSGFGQESTIVKTSIPTNLLTSDMFATVDRGISSVVIPNDTLSYLYTYIILNSYP